LQNYLHFHIVQLRSVEYKNIISFIQIASISSQEKLRSPRNILLCIK